MIALMRLAPSDILCAQFHYRAQATNHYSLTSVLAVLWTDAQWTTPDQRDALERRLRAGEVITTRHARYQVLPEHVEVTHEQA